MKQNVRRKSAKSSSGKCKGVGNRAYEKCHTQAQDSWVGAFFITENKVT